MTRLCAACAMWVAIAVAVVAQRTGPSPAEITQAEADVPQLIEVLGLRPGMVVADVGAGFGAMATVLAKNLGPTSRIYATDVAALQLDVLRRHQQENVIVIEGGARTTNLPEECCDAIYMRDVYHHLTQPADINRDLFASLKSGGRLAIIDFEPRAGSQLPDAVNANRGGHGIPPKVVEQEVAASGFRLDRTIPHWPDDQKGEYFLVLSRKP